MNILMILESSFPPDRRVENEATSLIKDGHTVYILCTSSSGNKIEKYKGINVYSKSISKIVHKSSVGSLVFPVYFSFWKARIKSFLRQHKIDVVHLHDLPLVKPVVKLQKLFPYKIVLDLHENWPALLSISPHTKSLAGRLLININQWKKYEKKYIHKVDSIIVVVDEAKKRLESLSNKVLSITVVSNTIKLEDVDSISISDKKDSKKTKIIYEGGITYHRGLQFAIKAFKNIDEDLKERSELLIVGKGSYLSSLENIVSREMIKNVRFLGWKSQEEVYKLLFESDIALIPHIKSEHTDSTIPHKLFHYIYSEIPILSSDCLPLIRIIQETNSGLIYKHNDITDMAEKLSQLIRNMNERVKYSQGRSFIVERFNWNEDEKRLLSLYNAL